MLDWCAPRFATLEEIRTRSPDTQLAWISSFARQVQAWAELGDMETFQERRAQLSVAMRLLSEMFPASGEHRDIVMQYIKDIVLCSAYLSHLSGEDVAVITQKLGELD